MNQIKFVFISLASVLFVGCNSNSEPLNSKFLTGDLQSGPYTVGFKVYHEYDYSRAYGSDYNEDYQYTFKESPRPMQIAVWYPSNQSGGEQMQYKDYFYTDDTKENFIELTRADKDSIDQLWLNDTGDKEGREILKNYMEKKVLSIPDAKVADGKFPLILYSVREFRGVYMNSPLCEYLASHGYIVAATPDKGQQPNTTFRVQPKHKEASIDDIQFLKGYMRNFENVDVNHVGIMGYSEIAVQKASEVALRDQNISAIAFLDGRGYSIKDTKAPIIQMSSSDIPEQHDVKQVKYADRYYLKFSKLTHLGFAPFFNIVWLKTRHNPDNIDYQALDEGYDLMSEYVLHFFNQYLKKDENASQFLQNRHRQDSLIAAFDFKAGVTPPPNKEQFLEIIKLKGAGKAMEILKQIKAHSPDHELGDLSAVNKIGYNLLGQQKFEEAMAIFQLNMEDHPKHSEVYSDLAKAYEDSGNTELAIENYKKAMSTNPNLNQYNTANDALKALGVVNFYPAYELSERIVPSNRKFLGSWKGSINANGNNLNTTITIENEKGRLGGNIDNYPIKEVRTSGNILSFMFIGNAGTVQIELTFSGRELNGSYKIETRKIDFPISLKK